MKTTTIVTSAANPILKDVRRAISRGALTSQGLLVAETFYLLDEAKRSPVAVEAVLTAATARRKVEERLNSASSTRLIVVEDALFEDLVGTETAQGVIALVRPPDWKLDDLFAGVPMIVVLDGVQDPGNAGAVVRAAEAFGASGVLFLKGTVSPFNAKTIRASAGSLFRLAFLAGIEADRAQAALQRRKVRVFAADPRGELSLGEADLQGPAALVIGSEARGVSAELSQASARLRIPTQGVESLNAALAAAVILYEASRQRTSL